MSVFCYDNVITRETTNVSIYSGDENPSYPLSNIQHIHLTKVYRGLDGSQTIRILIDAGEPVNCDYFMIRTAGAFDIDSLNIKGNIANDWGAAPFSKDITTLNSTYGFGYKSFGSTQTYRFWLLEVRTLGTYVELANIFLGPRASELDNQEFNQGWTHVNVDTSTVQVSEQGQRYIHELPDIARIQASMSLMDETETAALDAIYEYCGVRRPFWLIPTIDNSIKYANQYFFEARPVWTQDRYRLHSTTISLTEAK